jgi:membrane-bound ClpP family serine protease
MVQAASKVDSRRMVCSSQASVARTLRVRASSGEFFRVLVAVRAQRDSINYAVTGLALLVLGLMIAAAHNDAMGAIGIGGIIDFLIGKIMMASSNVPAFEPAFVLS